ncbi:MAG: undecaprenyldiphospho-muramoylpentapeptide beta-N-acetylglucosaminyltransferase [Trueperaceae bacterium]
MKLVFATGGTGGHIFPAIAVANEAKGRGDEAIFIGHESGMEAELVPGAGFPFYGVTAGKWDRQKPNPKEFINAWRGQRQAVNLLKELQPELVIGFGGFASFPGIAAARWLNVPYVLHEANAYPGLVTRLFARAARTVVLSQDATAKHLHIARKTVLGFPVRETHVEKDEARRQLGLPDDAVVTFVMGGSQGSVFLNNAVPLAFQHLTKPTFVLHSSGNRWEELVRIQTQSFSHYAVHGFVNSILAWSAADLAITRAGFGTLSEAAFHGIPTLMLPLSTSSDNHQLRNAQAVAKTGAGWVVEERHSEDLARVWNEALEHDTRYRASVAATQNAKHGVTTKFVDLIHEILTFKSARMLEEKNRRSTFKH